MKLSLKTGLCFGLTSGTITTLGLMIGLHSGTQSRLAIIGGIIIIAIADAFSDALGIHISEEAKNHSDGKIVWESTVSTFLTKFFYALTFTIPVILIPNLLTAMIVGIIWGLTVLSVLSFKIARDGKEKTWKVVAEHFIIALAVIIISHFVGDWVREVFYTTL